MPSKIYVNQESALRFRPSTVGGAGSDLNVTSLASGAGKNSAQVALAAGARASFYEWRGRTVLANPVLVGSSVQLYIATSDGTITDGGLGAGAGTVTANSRRNLQFIGSLEVDATGSAVTLKGSGLFYLAARYFQLVVWNGTDVGFSATDTDHEFFVVPSPDELQ